jgi:hypothetical protein
MARRYRYPCTFRKACRVLWIVRIEGETLTHAALMVGLNVGTVSHIVHGRRFPDAVPIPAA